MAKGSLGNIMQIILDYKEEIKIGRICQNIVKVKESNFMTLFLALQRCSTVEVPLGICEMGENL